MILATETRRVATRGGVICFALLLFGANLVHAQESSARRIPMSAAILRAHAAGTRDSSGRPGKNYWALTPAYTISAYLDPATSIVRGRARIVFSNPSPLPIPAIQLRLDQNRFRSRTIPDAEVRHPTQGMVVTRLTVDGEQASIGPTANTRRPALTGTQRTSERLDLVKPVAPHDSVVIEIEWHFEVPLDLDNGALRLGRTRDSTYQVAQWYPRIAMFDDLNGWDTTSYTGRAEFYNPYSSFDVQLDVPGSWLVGATGVLQNAKEVLSARSRSRLASALAGDSSVTIVGATERERGAATHPVARHVWKFTADSVSDFAWGTSRRSAWVAVPVSVPGRGIILTHLLLRPENALKFPNAAAMLRDNLVATSSLLTPYAYPQHTLLDGPERGMEYPMLTMSHGSRLDHEVAHQWFPMTVGTNETWYSFMDEGLANYIGTVVQAARTKGAQSTTVTHASRPIAPLIWPDDRGPPHEVAALYGYGKPLEMFAALELLVGQRAVLAALREYAAVWRFKHPTPWDFMFFMNRALGRDLDAFWFQWLFSAG